MSASRPLAWVILIVLATGLATARAQMGQTATNGAGASVTARDPESTTTHKAARRRVGTPLADASLTVSETHAQQIFAALAANPLELHAFLREMPKGADLHMHLSGAVYAETLLKDARADLLCVNPKTLSLTKNIGHTATKPVMPVCAEGDEPAADAFHNQALYNALVDALSMRTFVPRSGISGHDQFFSTFDRFGAVERTHRGEWLDEVASRAASQNEQYLEIMETPTFSHAAKLGRELGWPEKGASAGEGGLEAPGDDVTKAEVAGTTTAELTHLRERLLEAGLRDEVGIDRKEFHDALAERSALEHCGQTTAHAACAVKIKFLYQVLRDNPPAQVFAQTLLGFEVASADPDVVGVNFVQPEDDLLSMSEYHRQMLMLDYLHTVYPKVHISLHAGELVPGLVPPAGLRFHIREAIDLGHAERIGHGVDVLYEDSPEALLHEMAEQHTMVEINLTSNEVILGVTPPTQPLPLYLAAGVPVALSTDDEGVSRIDLTDEYTQAAVEFSLSYPQLKDMARTGVEHSFLPGDGLWLTPEHFNRVVAACSGQPVGAELPKGDCIGFLKANEKAREEWELERRFNAFEASLE